MVFVVGSYYYFSQVDTDGPVYYGINYLIRKARKFRDTSNECQQYMCLWIKIRKISILIGRNK